MFKLLITSLALLVIMLQIQGFSASEASASTVSSVLQNVEDLNKEHKYENSLQLLLHAMESNPTNTILLYTFKKTFALLLTQQLSEGFKYIADNKNDAKGYIEVARAYSLVGDQFKSMEILTEGIMENPSSVELWMAIGALELQAKREAEAVSVFREVIRIDGKNSHAHNNVAFVLARSEDLRLHDLDEALSHAQKAVALDPTNPNFIDTLAEIRYQLGEQREAVALMKKAINLAPNEGFFRDQLTRFETGVMDASEAPATEDVLFAK